MKPRTFEAQTFEVQTAEAQTTEPQTSGAELSEIGGDPVTARVREAGEGLAALLAEAESARRQRSEGALEDGSAVCAWNHFENIPTFYNWNNRPR